MYIGIAGEDSHRSLQERYKDYLRQSYILSRPNIAFMIGNWSSVLNFFYAPVDNDVSTQDLKLTECQLNSALMPVYSFRDMDSDTRRKRRAFP